jgi:hypothetical protein
LYFSISTSISFFFPLPFAAAKPLFTTVFINPYSAFYGNEIVKFIAESQVPINEINEILPVFKNIEKDYIQLIEKLNTVKIAVEELYDYSNSLGMPVDILVDKMKRINNLLDMLTQKVEDINKLQVELAEGLKIQSTNIENMRLYTIILATIVGTSTTFFLFKSKGGYE